MTKELPPPNNLFVSFMTTRMLNGLQENSEQEFNTLYQSIIDEKKGYDQYDWESVKEQIFERVESAAMDAGILKGKKKTKKEEEPKAKKGKERKPKGKKLPAKKKTKEVEEEETAEEESEEESIEHQLPKKWKTKRGAEAAVVGKEVHVSGKPGKVGVKCAPGLKPYEREVDDSTKAYGCSRNKKGQI
jgi:hypothetical protein